jgi:hypothetical protein
MWRDGDKWLDADLSPRCQACYAEAEWRGRVWDKVSHFHEHEIKL